MIARIANPYVRRAALIATAVITVPLLALIGAVVDGLQGGWTAGRQALRIIKGAW